MGEGEGAGAEGGGSTRPPPTAVAEGATSGGKPDSPSPSHSFKSSGTRAGVSGPSFSLLRARVSKKKAAHLRALVSLSLPLSCACLRYYAPFTRSRSLRGLPLAL